MKQIYVDHAATTPMHPEVIETMTSIMMNEYGNPSSIHTFGRAARKYVEEARKVLANSIGAQANEVIFTSGGTEADNMAIIGIATSLQNQGKHIITTQIEHHAVLHTCQYLEQKGYEVTYLPVNEYGSICLEELQNALREDTILVSIMFGNNEVGTIQPIKEIGELLKDHQAVFHTDAVQAYGIERIHVKKMYIDLLSVSAHKINGPKGIGFLYARQGLKLARQIHGGEQERKRRAGTENVYAIAGFQKAVEKTQESLSKKREQYHSFKKIFLQILKEEHITYQLNGSLDNALPHILNLSFPGMNVESFLVNLDLVGIAASSGSACTAGSIDPSHVLVAMFGKDSIRTKDSIRFSFGMNNTEEDIIRVAKETAKIVNKLVNK